MKKILFLFLLSVSLCSFGQHKKKTTVEDENAVPVPNYFETNLLKPKDTTFIFQVPSFVARELASQDKQEKEAYNRKMQLMLYLISLRDSTALIRLTEYPQFQKSKIVYKVNK